MHKATNRLHKLLGNLRVSCEALSDGQLLARFISRQDDLAFTMLLRRHGPMVLGVCRRVLRHSQDAEDVFQATFLILARKARSVLNREAIGSWLYRVAYRAAQEARGMRARRRAKEKPLEDAHQPAGNAAAAQDWRPVLDHELNRLPEKYRAPIVLCDLEAWTRKDAAQQLGVPDSTLSSRLAYGRKLLATRLARRGVTLGTGALVGLLSEGVLGAHVPAPLVTGTAKAAVLMAAGQLATASNSVAILMKGVLKSMFIAKLKTFVGFAALAVLTLGFGSAAYQTVGAQNVPSANQGAARPLSELEALRKENELLKLNLQVVLEKVHSQEIELRAQRAKLEATKKGKEDAFARYMLDTRLATDALHYPSAKLLMKTAPGLTSGDSMRQAVEALTQAVQRLQQEIRLQQEMDKTKKDANIPRP